MRIVHYGIETVAFRAHRGQLASVNCISLMIVTGAGRWRHDI